MNITDVGHSPFAEELARTMEKGARHGKTAWEIARLYTDAFVADMKLLDIEDPTVLCRATDHIPEQIDFIADIEKNGYAYRTSDGLYFDTSKQPDYGYLARLIPGWKPASADLGKEASGPILDPGNSPPWPRSGRGMGNPGAGAPGWKIECRR
jgi:cysteinyl-tRNA synthetase